MSKEGFLIYTGLYASIREFLTQDQKGDFLDAIHDFQESGIEPPRNSPIAMAFSIYKNQFRLDNAKHEKRAEKARQNGAKGGRPPKTEQNPENPVGYLGFGINPEKPNESYKEKEKEKEKEKDKVKDKEKELPNESIGVGGLSLSKNFDQKIAAWAEIWGTIGTRRKTENAYIEAVKMIMGDGGSEIDAHNALGRGAAADRSFCIAVGRKRLDPHTWLANRGWERDYAQELNSHKEVQNSKTQVQNGKSTRADEARAYTDSARRHAEWVESQVED